MLYSLKCNACGATGTGRGHHDYDTNATVIAGVHYGNGPLPEWEDGNDACDHEDFTITDESDDDPD
jgi:hypothetical protein